MDPERLWVTVYEGGDGVPRDDEAIDLWRAIGQPAERIVALGEDNFWKAGPTGPCGPCSELFYDRGPEHGCGRPLGGGPDQCGPQCDCDRVLEYWNLVFMQFDRSDDGLTPLPKPSIDTGAGVERISALLQGVHSVYETDGFQEVISALRVVVGRDVHRRRRLDARAARAGRPRPRHGVPGHRRRHPVERAARLHPAPHHPPRRLARPPHRPAVAVPDEAARRHRRPVRRGVSRPRPAPRPGGRDPVRRGGALHAHARDRHRDPRRRDRHDEGRGRHRDPRRRRVPAARHLRLPDRGHGRDRRRARPRHRRGRLRRADGRAAPPRPRGRQGRQGARGRRGVRPRGRVPHRVHRLRRPRRRDHRRGRAGARRRPPAREAAPLAVLSRGRRPGVGPRRRSRAPPAAPPWSRRTASTATRRSPSCSSTARSPPARRCAPTSTPTTAGRPSRTTPAPTCCTARCARCWAITRTSAARPCAPTSCASTSRTPAR